MSDWLQDQIADGIRYRREQSNATLLDLIKRLAIDEPLAQGGGDCHWCGHYIHLYGCPWVEARDVLGLPR